MTRSSAEAVPEGQGAVADLPGSCEKIQGTVYGKWCRNELLKFCECRCLKPQRQVKISAAEEELRCRLTWQQFDKRFWIAAFGSDEDLAAFVVSPKRFRHAVQSGNAVLGFSDQVPWWGLISRPKELFLKGELQPNPSGHRPIQKRGGATARH